MATTVRVTLGTCDTEPGTGFRRYPAGTVVDLDDEKARRWIRNGFAVEWHGGAAGSTVSDAEAGMSDDEIEAEIRRLRGLQETLRNAPTAPEAAVGLPEDQPIGRTPYEEAGAPHPLAEYNLTPQQVAALERAGFGRPALIRRAKDEELLEVPGVGVSTLAKLRGKTEGT